MTMAKSAGAQKPDFEMVNALEKAHVLLKEIFESSKKGKGNPDFSKTIKSPETVNFWKTVTAISKEHDMMFPEAETDPSKDHSTDPSKDHSKAIDKKYGERDSSKRPLKEDERSEMMCDTKKPVSSASSSTKPTESQYPDIVDLSDPNRPTQLAVRFSVLYNNEWKSCYETVHRHFATEKSAIKMLLRTCLKIYNRCHTIASDEFNDLQRAFTTFSADPGDTLIYQMKQRRRRTNQVDIDFKRIKNGMEESLTDIFGPDLITHKHVHAFMEKCLEICWLMVIQDPPVTLGTEINRNGQMFDDAVYRPYTQAGNVIAYIVWPAVYTHQGGDILSKGVAQGFDASDSVGGKRRQ